MAFADVGYRFEYMEWAKTVMEAGLRGVIDVGSSGIAPVTMRELGIRISDLELFGPHFYGEPELRRRIATQAKTVEQRVLPTLGASHAHALICASLIEPGDEVIVETPGYAALSLVPRALGAKVVPLHRRFEDRFQFDPAELRRILTKRTRLILVTNPHNPSGVGLAPECLAALAECAGGDPAGPHAIQGRDEGTKATGAGRSPRSSRASEAGRRPAETLSESRSASRRDAATVSRTVARGVWVIVNEVYRDFIYRDPPTPGHELGLRGVSLGSLTKVYGLGESRVGWAIADPGLVHRASRVNDFGVVNGPYVAERIGAIALARRKKLLSRARAILRRNRAVLDRFLRATPGLPLVPPAGGTIAFPRLTGIEDTSAFARRALRDHGVCAVPGEFFGAPGHIRIGIGGRDAKILEEGLRRLAAAIGKTRES